MTTELKHFLEAQRDFIDHYLADPVSAAAIIKLKADAVEHRNEFEIIIDRVATQFNLSADSLRRKCRIRRVRDARWVCYRFCHNMTDAPQNGIARFFNVDHASVAHGIKRVQDLIDTDRKFGALVAILEKDIAQLIALKKTADPFGAFDQLYRRTGLPVPNHQPGSMLSASRSPIPDPQSKIGQ
jgi:hypothetical protein